MSRERKGVVAAATRVLGGLGAPAWASGSTLRKAGKHWRTEQRRKIIHRNRGCGTAHAYDAVMRDLVSMTSS